MAGPLSHVRVLDLSRILAAPWAGQILADLGADVVKVEKPKVGDDTRGWGPPFLKSSDGNTDDQAAYYLAVNRGKRSITIDLDCEQGQELVRRLAARSDILLENYKVGTLAKYHIGYEDLKTVNPRLIYCSVTGFGQTGPRRNQAAYDFMIQGMGGLMSVTGERDGQAGGGPQKVGLPIVDLMSGMYAAVAVLAALARREVSAVGDHIDIGMLDVQVATLSNQAMNYLISGVVPKRTGNAHPNIQPQDVFECSDGTIAIAVGNDAQFARFCEILGISACARDERFKTNAARVQNIQTLGPIVKGILKQKSRTVWLEEFERAGVPAGPINTIAEVFEDPQVKYRGMLCKIPDAAGGTVPLLSTPMRFTTSPTDSSRPPPRLGQHNEEILHELGIGAAQVRQLRANGVI
jgi:crotonobetainyl-CoA:carnitine CoA-transferase CaiB-like acyl-CoA transferase